MDDRHQPRHQVRSLYPTCRSCSHFSPPNTLIRSLLLITQLNVTIESILSISPSTPGDESQIFTSGLSSLPEGEAERDEEASKTPESMAKREKRKVVLRIISRIITTAICAVTAILLPGFGKVMAFLGSFSAFLICIILPVRLFSFSPLPCLMSYGSEDVEICD
jgi:hypothetical protein